MFRAVLNLLRRVTCAASLLFLLICGAEVAVRIYEAVNNTTVCPLMDGVCQDPSNLTIPSWSIHQELRPSATAKVECRDSKTEIELRTNSCGLRGAEPVVPKPSNVYRIVVLGDETIYAPETPETSHFCARLQTQLQSRSQAQIEVINAGVPGHCPLTEFVLFKHRLMGLQPDLLLLHFDWSDVADDRRIRRLVRCDASKAPLSCPHPLLVASKKARTHEVWRRQFRLLDWALSAVSSEWKLQVARQRAASRDIDTNAYAWLRDEHPEKNAAFWLTVKPIADLAELCRSSRCSLVVMTSPKPWQVSSTCSRGSGARLNAGVAREAFYSSRAPFNVLARFMNHHNIPLVDGSTVMTPGQHTEENFLQHAPRWSSIGHDRLAELVGGFLTQRVSGPWSSYDAPSPLTLKRPGDAEIERTGGQLPSGK